MGIDTYIHTCRPTATRRAIFRERRIFSVTFAVGLLMYSKLYFPVACQFVNFGLLGEQSPQNGRFPAQDADEPPCKI